jgi:cysteinyl-tRNA synthetase
LDTAQAIQTIQGFDQVLALLQDKEEAEEWILQRIEERRAARARKDFATADRIRQELEAQGILLEDGPQVTRWRRK